MDLIGKQLPSVSAADNGKVLGVENGRWKAVKASQAVEPVFVTVKITGGSAAEPVGTWTGATWEELQNAFMHNIAGIYNKNAKTYIWFNANDIIDNLPALASSVIDFTDTSTVTHITTYCKSDGTVRVIIK